MLREPWKTRAHFAVDDQGFMAEERPNPTNVDRDATRRLDALAKRPRFAPSSENQRALARIGEIADREGFAVYLANPPVYRGLAESPAFQRHHADVTGMLEDLASRYGNVHFIDREFPFARTSMQNADHLVAGAATRYSRELAGVIADERGPRLARLPLGPPRRGP
jgi:hypothetical protein